MNNIKAELIKAYADDAIKVLDYYTRNIVIPYYGSSDKLKTVVNSIYRVRKQDNTTLSQYMIAMPNIISKLCPQIRVDGRLVHIAREVKQMMTGKYRVVGKKDIAYKTGKEYHRLSYIIVQPGHIDEIMHDKSLETSLDNLETVYPRRVCRLIRKLVMGRANKDNDRTAASTPATTDTKTSSTTTSTTTTTSTDKETIAKLVKAMRLLDTKIEKLEDENTTLVDRFLDIEMKMEKLEGENRELKSKMNSMKMKMTESHDEIDNGKSATGKYGEDERIDWVDTTERKNRKNALIRKCYDKLHTMSTNTQIPNDFLDKFVKRYKLNKPKSPYNGWNWQTVKNPESVKQTLDEQFQKICEKIDGI